MPFLWQTQARALNKTLLTVSGGGELFFDVHCTVEAFFVYIKWKLCVPDRPKFPFGREVFVMNNTQTRNSKPALTFQSISTYLEQCRNYLQTLPHVPYTEQHQAQLLENISADLRSITQHHQHLYKELKHSITKNQLSLRDGQQRHIIRLCETMTAVNFHWKSFQTSLQFQMALLQFRHECMKISFLFSKENAWMYLDKILRPFTLFFDDIDDALFEPTKDPSKTRDVRELVSSILISQKKWLRLTDNLNPYMKKDAYTWTSENISENRSLALTDCHDCIVYVDTRENRQKREKRKDITKSFLYTKIRWIRYNCESIFKFVEKERKVKGFRCRFCGKPKPLL